MTAGEYRWVCTDRRSEADVLKEIAEADTPVVILSRDDPAKLVEIILMVPSPRNSPPAIYLFEPLNSDHDLSLKLTRNWPFGLSILVTHPAAFGVLALSGTRIAEWASDLTETLWHWIVNLHANGSTLLRKQLLESVSYRRIGDIVRHRLVPEKPHRFPDVFREQIEEVGGVTYRSGNIDVTALRAGLFQWHDALDESHQCSQSIEGKGRKLAGDYWHAIMHRREPDYGNSKYWFRRVGEHPIFPELGRRAEPILAAAAPEWKDRLLKNGWNPFAFVDFCETISAGDHPDWQAAAEEIQELEMLLLLDSTYHDALL